MVGDAFVIVVVNGEKIQASEIRQMLGRGSRSQGGTKGKIVMVSKSFSATSIVWGQIQSRAHNFDADQIKNLKPLFDTLVYASPTLVNSMKKAYSDNAWRIETETFAKNHFGLLKKMRAAKTAGTVQQLISSSQME